MDLAAHRAPPMEPVDESLTDAEHMFAKRGCCYFFVPCLRSNPSSSSSSTSTIWWQRIHPPSGPTPWWHRALLKVREWSELVAGPRWKTFLRRFRRGVGGPGAGRPGRFQYDPLSYAMNFDEGGAHDDPLDADGNFPGFSARYASFPASARSSMDLGGRDAPTFFADKIGS